MAGSAILGMICLFISINSNFSLKSDCETVKGTEGLDYFWEHQRLGQWKGREGSVSSCLLYPSV